MDKNKYEGKDFKKNQQETASGKERAINPPYQKSHAGTVSRTCSAGSGQPQKNGEECRKEENFNPESSQTAWSQKNQGRQEKKEKTNVSQAPSIEDWEGGGSRPSHEGHSGNENEKNEKNKKAA